MLRFLVEEMGFNTFGIEATWPEARLLDRYVRTGEGDARELLQGLFFWTWRTESVLEMIEWMRAHNEAGGDVGFHGFDMQFPGLALENVRAYFREVDPDRVGIVNEWIQCLDAFANDERGRFPGPALRNPVRHLSKRLRPLHWRPSADCCSCGARGMKPPRGTDAFEVAPPEPAGRGSVPPPRDRRAAPGTSPWPKTSAGSATGSGPDGRMVLWAHNYHVSTQEGAQGAISCGRPSGDDMVVVGFSHARGGFTAVTRSDGQYRGLAAHELDEPVEGSFESYLDRASAPRFRTGSPGPGRDLAGKTRGLPKPGRSGASAPSTIPTSPVTTGTTPRSGSGTT